MFGLDKKWVVFKGQQDQLGDEKERKVTRQETILKESCAEELLGNREVPKPSEIIILSKYENR